MQAGGCVCLYQTADRPLQEGSAAWVAPGRCWWTGCCCCGCWRCVPAACLGLMACCAATAAAAAFLHPCQTAALPARHCGCCCWPAASAPGCGAECPSRHPACHVQGPAAAAAVVAAGTPDAVGAAAAAAADAARQIQGHQQESMALGRQRHASVLEVQEAAAVAASWPARCQASTCCCAACQLRMAGVAVHRPWA